jgi:dienelactone hydrolase
MRIKKSSGICVAAFSMVLVFLLVPPLTVAKRDPTVCDDLKGKAFGLCNAYCEALDCDWDPNASERACESLKSNYSSLTGESEFPCETMSLGCVTGDTGEDPPYPFDIGDKNDYGDRVLDLTVPEQCECDPSDSDCTPCPIVVGFHGYGQTGTSPNSWQSRLEPKGAAAGFISLYPTGDMTPNSYTPSGTDPNWAVPSCQDPNDGCLEEENCDWCGDWNEDNAVSTQREIDFTRAIVKWTMDNHCVDPKQIFATGYSNGGLWSHELARNPATSKLFKAIVPVDGVDQAGINDPLKWISAPPDGDSPWVLHVNEVFDRLEPYDGRPYNDWVGWYPVWIYPPVLQIFAEYLKNDAYSACGFGPEDVGNRFGEFAAGGVVPAGYRRLYALEGEGQDKFYCFTKDANGSNCERLAICLWDSGAPGDDLEDPHGRAGREWTGGTDPGTGGLEPMDIMWRFMKASVGVSY